jgi:hypothetical protein
MQEMKTRRILSTVLTVVAGILFFFAMMARIDTQEEHASIRVTDVVIGLMFAGAFALRRPGVFASWRPALVALLIWLMVSGGLVSCHEFQVHVRTSGAQRGITRSYIRYAYQALQDFADDCRAVPTEEQGLAALLTDPGVENWSGPYLDVRVMKDMWQQDLRYTVNPDGPQVWSVGRDGIGGSTDDIRVDDVRISIEQAESTVPVKAAPSASSPVR